MMLDKEHAPSKTFSWVQFDVKTREVYGMYAYQYILIRLEEINKYNTKCFEIQFWHLHIIISRPLEEHCSKWEYAVKGTNGKGASGTAIIHIQVETKTDRKKINHEFYMKLKIEKMFSAAVDWQIHILKGTNYKNIYLHILKLLADFTVLNFL